MSNSKTKDPDDQLKSFRIRAFTWISGLLVMLGILKFGTPIILQEQLQTPKEWIEWIFFAWPMETAYALFAAWVLIGIRTLPFRKSTFPKFLWLPLIWLGWQFLSGLFTVDKSLTSNRTCTFHRADWIVLRGLFFIVQM